MSNYFQLTLTLRTAGMPIKTKKKAGILLQLFCLASLLSKSHVPRLASFQMTTRPILNLLHSSICVGNVLLILSTPGEGWGGVGPM